MGDQRCQAFCGPTEPPPQTRWVRARQAGHQASFRGLPTNTSIAPRRSIWGATRRRTARRSTPTPTPRWGAVLRKLRPASSRRRACSACSVHRPHGRIPANRSANTFRHWPHRNRRGASLGSMSKGIRCGGGRWPAGDGPSAPALRGRQKGRTSSWTGLLDQAAYKGVHPGRGVEEIRTPAGSFRAYRLHSIWRWFSDAGGALGHSEQEDWLSAQVRFYVMGRWKEGADSGDYELVEYTLAP